MNSFGRIFRIEIFGESHGKMVGILLDGVPPGIPLTESDFSTDLERRKPGKKGTTPRKEPDQPKLLAGVFNDFTTGAPLMIGFENTNVRSKDYEKVLATPRPGHADFVANKKFRGFNDHRGGGHFSGRLTLALVAAGVVAKKILGEVRIAAQLTVAGGRPPEQIDQTIENVLETGDSIGGVVECRATGLPIGWGEPFFDSIESVISHLVFSIPAIRGIEFGSGFMAAQMKGSEHNDVFEDETGKTRTNHAGGISGGISNGNELVFRVAVKPTSSIGKAQQTLDFKAGKITELEIRGRHDACIALRVPVVLEAVTAVALADLFLLDSTTGNRQNPLH
jgi:chorismate synthase